MNYKCLIPLAFLIPFAFIIIALYNRVKTLDELNEMAKEINQQAKFLEQGVVDPAPPPAQSSAHSQDVPPTHLQSLASLSKEQLRQRLTELSAEFDRLFEMSPGVYYSSPNRHPSTERKPRTVTIGRKAYEVEEGGTITVVETFGTGHPRPRTEAEKARIKEIIQISHTLTPDERAPLIEELRRINAETMNRGKSITSVTVRKRRPQELSGTDTHSTKDVIPQPATEKQSHTTASLEISQNDKTEQLSDQQPIFQDAAIPPITEAERSHIEQLLQNADNIEILSPDEMRSTITELEKFRARFNRIDPADVPPKSSPRQSPQHATSDDQKPSR